MIDDKTLRKFQKLLKTLDRERDESAGELKQIEKQLQENFEIKTYEQGQKLLKKLRKQIEKKYEKFAKQYNDFLGKNRKRLKRIDGIDEELLRPVPSKLPGDKEGTKKRKKTKKRSSSN
jgi:transcriptional regulator NrdR family protein